MLTSARQTLIKKIKSNFFIKTKFKVFLAPILFNVAILALKKKKDKYSVLKQLE